MLTINQSTRDILVPTTVVVDGETFVKKAKTTVPAVEVHYRGIMIAVFYQENTKGSLVKAAEEYLRVHGYLSMWLAGRWAARVDLSWDDGMKIDPSAAIAHCQALQTFNPTL